MMTDKEAQLKAKLLKMRLAAKSDGVTTAKGKVNKLKTAIVKSPDKYKVPREMKHTRVDSDGPLVNKVPFGEEDRETKQQGMDRIMRDSSYDVKNKKVRPAKPTQADRKRIITAQEHNHKISFRGHKIGGFKGASLNGQSGKYAKYWLLNAKETNGNGWGIAAHTAKENMKKFIGRPLVVTAQSWHGASEYGDEYEHPYLPTNDINAILNHQEKFRVGSIVDVFEDKHGDWYASIEMLPKFASSRLPPFCSPAIYQLDASEAEGQISKWEALHLAALTENPAYGARIALLKGTCVGTDNECKVQFKAAKDKKPTTFKRKLGTSRGFRESPASRSNKYNPSPTGSQGNMLDLISKNAPKKQTKVVDTPDRKFYNDNGEEISRDEYNKQAKIICPKKLKERISKLKKKQKISKIKSRLAVDTSKIKKKKYFNDETLDRAYNVTMQGGIEDTDKTFDNPAKRKSPFENFQIRKKIDNSIGNNSVVSNPNKGTNDDKKASGSTVINSFKNKRMKKLAKLKLKLASLGEQNMTYQDSKKVKIHKKKHPEVRKASLASEFAHNDIEGVLRKIHRSPLPPDKREHQSSFLSSTGDYIGGGEDHTDTIKSIFKDKTFTPEDKANDGPVTRFSTEHRLPRVQRRVTRRGGRVSFGIHAPVNSSQLRSMKDVEAGGEELAFVVGKDTNGTVGEGYRDLTKALRENKFLG